MTIQHYIDTFYQIKGNGVICSHFEKSMLQILETQIMFHCCHLIERDDIDITPEKSCVINYCVNCFFTKENIESHPISLYKKKMRLRSFSL